MVLISKEVSLPKDNLTFFLYDISLISNIIVYDFKIFIFIPRVLIFSVKYEVFIQILVEC